MVYHRQPGVAIADERHRASSPIKPNSQPIRLPGRCQATTTPTVENSTAKMR